MRIAEISPNRMYIIIRLSCVFTNSYNIIEFCNSLVLPGAEFNYLFKNTGEYNCNTGII